MKNAILLLQWTGVLALSGCANPHFFPKARPLFAGLDESKVPVAARPALAEAKADFHLARRGQGPRYAKFQSTDTYSRSQFYKGRGYLLTIAHKESGFSHVDGPKIEIDSSITGGAPLSYAELENLSANAALMDHPERRP